MGHFLKFISIGMLSVFVIACGDVQGFASGEGAATGPSRQVTLSWLAPTTNLDDSAIESLSSFRVYVSAASGFSSDDLVEEVLADSATGGNHQQVTISVPEGTYYFAVTAVDRADNESRFSDGFCRQIGASTKPC